MTEGDLDTILEDLRALEPVFRRPEATPESVAALLEPHYSGVTPSGNIMTASVVMDTMQAARGIHAPDLWPCSDFRVRQLAPDLYLLSYVMQETDRRTRRSSIWRQTGAGWRLVFHQGTEMV